MHKAPTLSPAISITPKSCEPSRAPHLPTSTAPGSLSRADYPTSSSEFDPIGSYYLWRDTPSGRILPSSLSVLGIARAAPPYHQPPVAHLRASRLIRDTFFFHQHSVREPERTTSILGLCLGTRGSRDRPGSSRCQLDDNARTSEPPLSIAPHLRPTDPPTPPHLLPSRDQDHTYTDETPPPITVQRHQNPQLQTYDPSSHNFHPHFVDPLILPLTYRHLQNPLRSDHPQPDLGHPQPTHTHRSKLRQAGPPISIEPPIPPFHRPPPLPVLPRPSTRLTSSDPYT